MLEKMVEIGFLFDFYGKLLTDKQQETMTLYYYDDLSLGEIAERLAISRQGVYDHLQRGEELLRDYEKKLQLVKKYTTLKEGLEGFAEYIQGQEINPQIREELTKKLKGIKEAL